MSSYTLTITGGTTHFTILCVADVVKINEMYKKHSNVTLRIIFRIYIKVYMFEVFI